MAAKSGKKRTAGSRRKTGKKTETTGQAMIGEEIVIWGMLAICILLLLSNFGLGGIWGRALSGVLKYVFGLVAYVVPFFLFGLTAFLVSNKENWKAWVKALAVVCLAVLACSLSQLILGQGGWLGNAFVEALSPAVGTAGTYVVVLAGIIICMVAVTGKSAWKGVTNQGSRACRRVKEDTKRRRALARERRMEEKEAADSRSAKNPTKRSSHHVEGVSFDTDLGKDPAPGMRELSAGDTDDTDGFLFGTQEEKPTDPQDFVKEPEKGTEPGDVPPWMPEAFLEKKELGENKKAAVGKAPKAVDTDGKIQPQTAESGDKDYELPPLTLLKKAKGSRVESNAALRETACKLQQTLHNFGVDVTVSNISRGPTVTRYELQPEMGVKVSRIVGLADDIKLNLAAADIRIEAPIPGKAAVGIEVPNKENTAVMLRELLETKEFQKSKSKLSFAAGKDIGGKPVIADIAKMPHLLIAGATGSGKSVCINTLIMSILYKATPDEVKLIMIDPKVVELSVYNGIPHLMIPVVTDPRKAAGALNWAVGEMTRRYQAFADHHVRDIKSYNEKIMKEPEIDGSRPARMPQIVIIVDELADLMMVASHEVEEAICRLAQLARAAGIHLVIATQRPSVNVITGLIKANMPSRIAFSVSSGVDSRTIIDMYGAEKLLGKGDMLFYPAGYPKPARVQGAFVTDEEVQAVVDFLKTNNEEGGYDEEIVQQVDTAEISTQAGGSPAPEGDGRDAYFTEAGRLIVEKEKASIGMLQRAFKIGFNRAARIMEQLCEAGVVGGEEGTKPRKVLMSAEEFDAMSKAGENLS